MATPSSTNYDNNTPAAANNESTSITSSSSFVTANNINSNSISNMFNSTPASTARGSKSSTSTTSLTTSGAGSSSSGSEAKIMSRYGSCFLADECHKRLTTLEHSKRLAYLRKEADMLDKTDWMYDSVEKLLGN